jgi:hypothetical protein
MIDSPAHGQMAFAVPLSGCRGGLRGNVGKSVMDTSQTASLASPEEAVVAAFPRLWQYALVLTGCRDAADRTMAAFGLTWQDTVHADDTGDATEGDRGQDAHVLEAFAAVRGLALSATLHPERTPSGPPCAGGARARGTPREVPVEEVESCLMQLPLPLREVLYLRHIEQWTLAGIARCIDVARATAALRARDALVLLNACLRERRTRSAQGKNATPP